VKIVVGLGNPGREYADTPHNAGFMVVEELAGRLGVRFRRQSRFQARMSQATLGSQPVLLVEPETYMNASGQAVAAVMAYYKVPTVDLVVVLDDADLEMGRMRIRQKGASGGHRGLESVIQQVGTPEFARVRVGIGRACDGRKLADHVLSSFSREEAVWMGRIVSQAADAVVCVVESGGETAMNRFNGVTVEQAEEKDSQAETAH
jgi:PTH1 family peptidyl-tRNA hydrolase